MFGQLLLLLLPVISKGKDCVPVKGRVWMLTINYGKIKTEKKNAMARQHFEF